MLSVEFWIVAVGDFELLSFELWVVDFEFWFWAGRWIIQNWTIQNALAHNSKLKIQNSKFQMSYMPFVARPAPIHRHALCFELRILIKIFPRVILCLVSHLSLPGVLLASVVLRVRLKRRNLVEVFVFFTAHISYVNYLLSYRCFVTHLSNPSMGTFLPRAEPFDRIVRTFWWNRPNLRFLKELTLLMKRANSFDEISQLSIFSSG